MKTKTKAGTKTTTEERKTVVYLVQFGGINRDMDVYFGGRGAEPFDALCMFSFLRKKKLFVSLFFTIREQRNSLN